MKETQLAQAEFPKTYQKPQLIEYGQVADMTLSGVMPSYSEGGLYTLPS